MAKKKITVPYLSFRAGQNSGIPETGLALFRYNSSLNRVELSLNGAPYQGLAGPYDGYLFGELLTAPNPAIKLDGYVAYIDDTSTELNKVTIQQILDLFSGAGSPGAPDGAVQFNNGGLFGGSSNLLWSSSTNRLQLADSGDSIELGAASLDATAALDISANASSVWQTLGGTSDLTLSAGGTLYIKSNNEIKIGDSDSGVDITLAATSTLSPAVFISGSTGYFGIGGNPVNRFTVASNKFQIDDNGDIVKIKDKEYTWPAAYGASGYVLTDTDGYGNLQWQSTASGTVNGTGTATQIAYFVNGTTIGSETAVGSESFTWDSTNELLGVRTASPVAVVDIQAGTTSSAAPGLRVQSTSAGGGFNFNNLVSVTSGVIGNADKALEVSITGAPSLTYGAFGIYASNTTTSTVNSYFTNGGGPVGIRGDARGVNGSGVQTGSSIHGNVGVLGYSDGSVVNVGVAGVAPSAESNHTNIGVVGTASNGGTGTAAAVGGLFSLSAAGSPSPDPSYGDTAALIADNHDTSAPIFLARDNGTTVFKIDDGGSVTIGQAGTSYTLPTARGTNGQVLQTDGSGGVSWQPVSGGGGTITGSGAATRVAFWDGTSSLSSDANLYWDDTNNRLGVGTSSPLSDIEISSDGSTTNRTSAFGTSVTPGFIGFRGRGTRAAPTAVQTGDTLFQFTGQGIWGSTLGERDSGARITVTAEENWTVLATGAKMVFSTNTIGATSTTQAERLSLSSAGIVVNGAGNNVDFSVKSVGNANMLFVDASANAIGVRTATPGAVVDVQAGTLLSGVPAENITATLANPGSTAESGVKFQITANGSANSLQFGVLTEVSGNYTGSGQTSALAFRNDLAGTGSLLFNDGLGMRPDGNRGIVGHGVSVTTGNNSAVVATAGSGNRNFGGYFSANIDKASALNVGVYGAGRNTAGSSTEIGGMFHLYSSTTFPTFESAALLADNGSSTSPIFLARDNGTEVVRIADGGNLGIGTSSPGTKLDVVGTTGMRFRTNSSSAGFDIFDRPTVPGDQLVFQGNTGNYTLFNVATKNATSASEKLSAFALWSVDIANTGNATQLQVQNNPTYGGVLFTQKFGAGIERKISLQAEWQQSSTPTQLVLDTNGNIGIGTASPTSTLSVAEKFQVNSSGNIIKINNIDAIFPSTQGIAGTVLENDGYGNLSWEPPGSGSGPLITPIETKTSNYTITIDDSTILADATSGAFAVTLPSAVSSSGYVFTIKKKDITSNVVTVQRAGSDLIDGASTYLLQTQYESIKVQSDGSGWWIV